MNESIRSENGGTLRTRATLLFRLKDWNDGDTWREFYDLYYNFVYRHGRNSGLDHHEAEEVTQEVFLAVSKKIQSFEPHPRPGSFRRWLGTLTIWRIKDKKRERRKPSDPRNNKLSSAEQENLISNIPAATAVEVQKLEESWRTELLETAMKRLAQSANPKHFQVFSLHHRDGWPLKRIANELGMSRPLVYVINHRLKSQLEKEVKSISKKIS